MGGGGYIDGLAAMVRLKTRSIHPDRNLTRFRHQQHTQTVVLCQGCNTVLCTPTGGKAKLTEVSLVVVGGVGRRTRRVLSHTLFIPTQTKHIQQGCSFRKKPEN